MTSGLASIWHLVDAKTIAEAALEKGLMTIEVYLHLCDHPLLRDHWITRKDGSALLDSTTDALRKARAVLLAQTDPSSEEALDAYAAINEALLPIGRMMEANELFSKAAELPIVVRLTPRPGGALEKVELELRSLNQLYDPRFCLQFTPTFSLLEFVQLHGGGGDA